MVLARMTARVDALPVVGEEHVVVGLGRGSEGRKTFTAATLYDSDGRVVGPRRAPLGRGRPRRLRLSGDLLPRMDGMVLNDQERHEWWRHAVTYQIYPRSFADANGDGVGDLPGITARLPYLRDLGVDAIWLSPFYTSPQHDHGYDVADYRDVDPLFGQPRRRRRADRPGPRARPQGDRRPGAQPHLRRARVVPGRAGRRRRAAPSGRATSSATAEAPTARRPTTGARSSAAPAWTQVPDGQWYLHLFDSSQPDLDWRNPEVGDMFDDVLRFWLDRGVDGFRVDVAHGLFKEESLRDQVVAEGEAPSRGATAGTSMVERTLRDEPMWDQPEVHDVYRRWHDVLAEYDGDRMLVAEAWTQTPESMARYIRPDEFSQAFNFAWLLRRWSADGVRRRHHRHDRRASARSAAHPPGCSATTTSSATSPATAAARSAWPGPARRR